jgi:hypothetical protein
VRAVQFDQSISYQGMPFGISHGTGTRIRFSGQRLKPFGLVLALAASLKRSPDTNHISATAILSKDGVHRA